MIAILTGSNQAFADILEHRNYIDNERNLLLGQDLCWLIKKL
jgi:hypothetical protein